MKKIVYVDDSQDILDVVTDHLKTMLPDCEIKTFNNPISAIEYMKTANGIELFLTDYSMPELNGPTVAKTIRNNGYRGYLAMLTGNSWFKGNSSIDFVAYKGDGLAAIEAIVNKVT